MCISMVFVQFGAFLFVVIVRCMIGDKIVFY